MEIAGKKKIVLLGMMTRMPVAGVVWQYLHYLIGLQRLGYDVYYVEAHSIMPTGFMKSKTDDPCIAAAAFIDSVCRRVDMGERWCFHTTHEEHPRCFGMSEPQLMDLYKAAHLLINLHGGTHPRPEHVATNRLVFLETDPVEIQIELYENRPGTLEYLKPHCAFFTFGENWGAADCKLPHDTRFNFHPTRQPVVMDLWETNGTPAGECFTTVGNWEQPTRKITFRGETYHWSKHYEFLKFLDLPSAVPAQPFELALARYKDADREMLEEKGWRVRPAAEISTRPEPYRQYILDSRGEFTVAKDQNVRLRSGWFSDRSATYLAGGRPVITQDTGFGNIIPTGRGLFAFSTLQDATAAVQEINADYEKHRRAAREIARAYFNYDVVLGKLLDEVGV